MRDFGIPRQYFSGTTVTEYSTQEEGICLLIREASVQHLTDMKWFQGTINHMQLLQGRSYVGLPQSLLAFHGQCHWRGREEKRLHFWYGPDQLCRDPWRQLLGTIRVVGGPFMEEREELGTLYRKDGKTTIVMRSETEKWVMLGSLW